MQICSHACLRWSDIERAGLKTLRLSCGRRDIDSRPVMLEIGPAAADKGARDIKVTIRTSPWAIFKRNSSMTGSLKLPSAKEILQTIAKSEKDAAATSLCPHASFNPAKWQMKLAPGHKREPCDISPNEDAVSKDFFSSRVNTTESPFKHLCPLCEITTTNEAPAIKSQTLRATHHDSCNQCKATYDWTWCSTRLSHHSSVSLELETTRQFTVTKPTDHEWLRNLEITPRGPTDPRGDPETEHLLWCKDEPGTFVNWNRVAQWARR